MTVAVVVPVHRNQATLESLAARLAAALVSQPWRLRLVVDASPDASLEVADRLAAADRRIAVTSLVSNVGQHEALRRGLACEDGADVDAWVLLDGDLQDPPEAVPSLVARLADGDVGAVFAGRTGRYETRGRLLTGQLHRSVQSLLTGLPADAGAFVALSGPARQAVLQRGGPSVVAALGVSGLAVASVPVVRHNRPAAAGRSSWPSRRRLGRSLWTLGWLAVQHARRRGGRSREGRPAAPRPVQRHPRAQPCSQRCRKVSA